IFTFKDGCLKSVQKEIASLRNLAEQQKNQLRGVIPESGRIIEIATKQRNEIGMTFRCGVTIFHKDPV
ncbi:MAG: hypothetical protein ACK5HT_04495, partial [Draconibacterium sp.]